MAARSRKKPVTVADAATVAPMELESIAELVQQFGEHSTKCRLFRRNDSTQRLEYLATTLPSVDLIEKTQQSYGGGYYSVQLCDDAGKIVKGAHMRFTIAGPSRFPDDDAPRAAVQAREPAAIDSGVERLVTIVTALVGAVSPLVVPLLNRKPAAEQSITDTLALMQAAEERGERRGEQLGALRAGGPSQPRESLADVARAYVPLVSTLIQSARMKPNGATPAAVPVPAAIAAPVAAPAAPVPDGYEWLATLRPYYPMLLQQAARGNDAAMLADFTLDQCDDALFELVEAAAQRPGFAETLTADMPAIAQQHPEWLAAYLARVVENCQPQSEPLELAPRSRKQAS